MKMKSLLSFLFLILSVHSFGQTNDLRLDSIFNRSNVNEYYINGLEYYRLPMNQLRPIECSALLSNIGSNDLTNCFLKVEVIHDGIAIISLSSDSVNIEIGNQDSLFLNGSIDLEGQPLGMYNLIYSIHSDSIEIDLSNNTKNIQFEITDHILSRSDFEVKDSTRNYYYDSLGLESFGYVFKLEENACLSSVNPWLSMDPRNADVLARISATLFVLDTIENEYLPVAVTDEFYAEPSDLGNPFRIPLDYYYDVEFLSAGNTYLVTVNNIGTPVDFYLSQETIDSTTYYAHTSGVPGGSYIDNVPLINTRIIKMDIEFDTSPDCFSGINNSKVSNLKIYPNPSQGIIKIDLNTTIVGPITIQILDLNGKICIENTISQEKTSATIQIDGSELLNGLYTIRLINRKDVFIKKVLINK